MQEEPPHFSVIRHAEAQEVSILQPEQEVPIQREIEASDSDVRCFCVRWLREVRGVDIRGDAYTIKPNSTPKVGGVILMSYPSAEHAGLITGFTDEGFIMESANKSRCKVTTEVVEYNSPFIRGFYTGESL